MAISLEEKQRLCSQLFPFFCCFYNCVHNFVSRKVPSWQPTPPTKRVSNLIDCESLMKEKHAEEINLMFSCVVSHSGPAVSHKIAQLCKSLAMISAALNTQFKHVPRNYFVSNKSLGVFFRLFFFFLDNADRKLQVAAKRFTRR